MVPRLLLLFLSQAFLVPGLIYPHFISGRNSLQTGKCKKTHSIFLSGPGNNVSREDEINRFHCELTAQPHGCEPQHGKVEKQEEERPGLLWRKLGAEWIGTLLLVMIVVGSGIMGETLSNDVGVQLLINSIATMSGLYGLITILGPISGAHFNPIVTFLDVLYGEKNLPTWAMYSFSQTVGAISGALLANMQFANPTRISTNVRWGAALWISEVIASATLNFVIHGSVRTGQLHRVPSVVALWVGGGHFFTHSTIFANPAVTIGRIFTESFAGIHPKSAGMYIVFQFVGALVGFGLTKLFYPVLAEKASVEGNDNMTAPDC